MGMRTWFPLLRLRRAFTYTSSRCATIRDSAKITRHVPIDRVLSILPHFDGVLSILRLFYYCFINLFILLFYHCTFFYYNFINFTAF